MCSQSSKGTAGRARRPSRSAPRAAAGSHTADGAGGDVVEPHGRSDINGIRARAVGQGVVIATCASGMDSDTNGIFILGRGTLAEPAKCAFEAASASDDRTISMPTTTGKRTAKLRARLTKHLIDALQPTDKPWIAWDDKQSGFVMYDFIPLI